MASALVLTHNLMRGAWDIVGSRPASYHAVSVASLAVYAGVDVGMALTMLTLQASRGHHRCVTFEHGGKFKPNRSASTSNANAKQRSPGTRETFGDQWAALSFDVRGAHKLVNVSPEEQGLSCFVVQGRWFAYRSCYFGCRWAAYWFARVGAFLVRHCHPFLWVKHSFFVYVDDGLALFPRMLGRSARCRRRIPARARRRRLSTRGNF